MRKDGGSRLLSKDVAEVTRRLRRLAFDLHPPDLESGGLVEALRNYIEGWSSEPGVIGYEVETDIAPPPTQISSLVYRIAQEALTNVRNHSTATRASVNISDHDGGVLVRISDNGTGFDVASVRSSAGEHFGLASMRERAEAVGGWCRIESSPAAGTLVECWLPLTDVTEQDDPASAVESDARATDPMVAHEAASEGSTAGHLADLTPRELEIAELLALGHTNKEIGAILHVSIRTVEHHRTSVFRKAGVHSRAGLIRSMREHHRGGAASDR
jgi:DNA-binding CsgD family transcriptional regulator